MSNDLKESILKMFQLAHLKLDDKRSGKYIDNASRVIDYFEQLNELDTSKVEPTAHAVEAESTLRDDRVFRFDKADKIVEQAPEIEGPFLKVPKVIQ